MKEALKKILIFFFVKERPSSFFMPGKSLNHWLLWVTLLFVFIFLIWANFAVLEEATVAMGKVIPLNQVQIIQNMDGGVIKKMLVHEGDIVQQGQILLVLDGTRFESALKEAEARSLLLQVRVARLTAEAENTPLQFDPVLISKAADLVKNEEELYQSRQKELKEMQENLALSKQELEMTKPLLKDGAVAEIDVLHLEHQTADNENLINDFNAHTLNDLDAAKGDLAVVNASIPGIQDQLDRTTIRAPVKGVVKQIRIATVGGVVLPGQEIMSIVPLEDTLLVEAQVKPSDIGFIHPGQQVLVKITAYDYSIYGGLAGAVTAISADTITNDKGGSYYLVRIKTQKNYLRTASNPLYIIPGMTATVNILTGKRTVLNYLLSPLLKAKENALLER